MVWQPPKQPTATPRVLGLVAPPEDEPERDCDADVGVLPEAQALVPINDLPQAPPAQYKIIIGVDIGGVLFGSEPNHVRMTIRTVEPVAQTVAAGAREWFEAYVFIVS
ncbi:MAG: hypothetical protein ACKPKO_25150, partial [Candidatus Fonsibacter sp.]